MWNVSGNVKYRIVSAQVIFGSIFISAIIIFAEAESFNSVKCAYEETLLMLTLKTLYYHDIQDPSLRMFQSIKQSWGKYIYS